ncbi:MAG: branched-chain amino acid ABC transporter permease [Hyphomicrobiales bacterium]|nr:MAG: branched-chain amino acid ABC transporter permease [Hyphomicrobiales bacterium]
MLSRRYEPWVLVVGLLVFAALPVLFTLTDNSYLVSTATRVVIFAIAAVSLDLILGYAGMVSFGHAAYLGVGAYVVGILAYHQFDGSTIFGLPGTLSGLIALPAAVLVSALFAAILGALSVRTAGVYFIMITLAFGQMLFFLFVSLEDYGGDDGLMMFEGRNTLPGFDLGDNVSFYYLCLAALVVFFVLCRRIVVSKFGRVIAGVRQNETRLTALGIAPYRYKLVAFTIAGAGAGLAGALLANHTEFVSPSYVHWTKSGEIMVMVILGGMGTLSGPIAGAALFLLLEEFLPVIFDALGLPLLQEHWRIVFGPLLILVVLFAKRGLYGLIFSREDEA